MTLFILLFVAHQPPERVSNCLFSETACTRPNNKECAELKANPTDGEPNGWSNPIVIITAGLLFIGAIQAIILGRTIKKSRESSEIQLRAYLGFDGEEPKSGDLAQFKIENFGETPALRVSC